MKVIEITEDKATKMASLVEEMLHAGGKLMTCIEQLRDDDGEMDYRRPRSRMDYRDGDRHEMRDRGNDRYGSMAGEMDWRRGEDRYR